MKYFSFVLVVIVLIGITGGVSQNKKLQRLRNTNESLEAAAKKIAVLRAENERLGILEVDQTELEKLRDQTDELMRLRSEVSRLRSTDAQDLELSRSRIEMLQKQANEDLIHAENLASVLEARRSSDEMKRIARAIYGFISESANLNQFRYPNSFQEAQDILNNAQHHSFVTQINELAKKGELSNFEILPFQERAGMNVRDGIPILREVNPRQQPDGQWARIYGFSNIIQETVLPENNFVEWERENFQ